MITKLRSALWMIVCLIILQTSALAAPQTGAAADTKPLSPMETVKQKVDAIISILNDPELSKPANRAAQRQKIWDISNAIFDFTEISRRTVGKAWTEFTDKEKNEFTDTFAQFLYNTYIEKVEGEYDSEKIGSEKIAWDKELIKGDRALVRSKLMRANASLPIDYKMQFKNNQWKIYDILVENGVSIVQNYRVQFQSILQKEKPAQLIEKLQDKLKKQQAQMNG